MEIYGNRGIHGEEIEIKYGANFNNWQECLQFCYQQESCNDAVFYRMGKIVPSKLLKRPLFDLIWSQQFVLEKILESEFLLNFLI